MQNLISKKVTVSNGLMLISLFFTILTLIPSLGIYRFGMNDLFFNQGIYHIWGIQMFTSQFLHGDFIHLLMNAVFILYFWNIVERITGSEKYLVFFILNAMFLWVLITFLWDRTTVGISWFALAVVTYYTLHLWSKGDPEYTWWVTAIVINIAIGLSPWISFLGHFGGMVFWWIFWFLTQNKK